MGRMKCQGQDCAEKGGMLDALELLADGQEIAVDQGKTLQRRESSK